MKNIAISFIGLLLVILNSTTVYCQDEDSFVPVSIQTGQIPGCYIFKPEFDMSLDNFLKINVGGESDVVLKMVNNTSGECVRYVYIKSGESFFITNIPKGVYHLKIAYGNNWAESGQGEKCSAKFLNNALYQIGNDLLDFYPIENYNGYQIPSFELFLKTFSNNRKNEFDAEEISEEEFFNN